MNRQMVLKVEKLGDDYYLMNLYNIEEGCLESDCKVAKVINDRVFSLNQLKDIYLQLGRLVKNF